MNLKKINGGKGGVLSDKIWNCPVNLLNSVLSQEMMSGSFFIFRHLCQLMTYGNISQWMTFDLVLETLWDGHTMKATWWDRGKMEEVSWTQPWASVILSRLRYSSAAKRPHIMASTIKMSINQYYLIYKSWPQISVYMLCTAEIIPLWILNKPCLFIESCLWILRC